MKFLNKRKPFRFDKTFVIATRGGLTFGVITLTMFLASATYANNLVYLLTFIVLSISIAALVITNFNVNGLVVQSLHVSPVKAGEQATLTLALRNQSSEDRSDIKIVIVQTDTRTPVTVTCPFIKSGECLDLSVNFLTTQRGVFRIDYIRCETTYPVDLWYAWSWQRVDCTYAVYPKAAGTLSLPEATTGFSHATSLSPEASGDDFTGHKRVEEGGSLLHIDWRIFARTDELWRKQFHDHEQGSYRLSWSDVKDVADPEEKLSQLCLWIENLSEQQASYALEMPTQLIREGNGPHQRAHCLEELAKYAA